MSTESKSLVQLLAQSQRAVFFGGAGVSTASGIPDFRSSAGLYASRTVGSPPPEYLLSHSCLVEDPEAFFDFHRTALLHPDAQPNRAHAAVARLEAAGKVSAVVTQNIDGLHQAAGSRLVHEVHGSAHRNHCVGCQRFYDMTWMLATTGVPRCDGCGEMVRPDVVLYEEALEPRVVDAAIAAILDSDLLIVAGTSLNVYPAAGMVRFAKGPIVLLNRDQTPFDDMATLVVHDDLVTALGDATDELLGATD